MPELAYDIPLGTALTEEQARTIFALGEQRAAETAFSHQTPSTPSGMQPVYKKPAASTRGRKKPGQKPGHPGTRRETPARIDRRLEHRAEVCPDCGGPLRRCQETRTRYTEDVPENIQPVITEHVIHRDWCPRCKKKVEPVVSEALPGASLGTTPSRLSTTLSLYTSKQAKCRHCRQRSLQTAKVLPNSI